MSESVQRKRISLELPADLLEWLDALKGEWGLRSRGDLFARLLETLLPTAIDADPAGSADEEPDTANFNEQGALVLVAGAGSSELLADFDLELPEGGPALDSHPSHQKGRIDLPGFVRHQSAQLKRRQCAGGGGVGGGDGVAEPGHLAPVGSE